MCYLVLIKLPDKLLNYFLLDPVKIQQKSGKCSPGYSHFHKLPDPTIKVNSSDDFKKQTLIKPTADIVLNYSQRM